MPLAFVHESLSLTTYPARHIIANRRAVVTCHLIGCSLFQQRTTCYCQRDSTSPCDTMLYAVGVFWLLFCSCIIISQTFLASEADLPWPSRLFLQGIDFLGMKANSHSVQRGGAHLVRATTLTVGTFAVVDSTSHSISCKHHNLNLFFPSYTLLTSCTNHVS